MSLEKQEDGKTGPLGLLGLLKVFALGGQKTKTILENVTIAEHERNKGERNDCTGEMCSPGEQ